MMNSVCDDLAGETTKAALEGGSARRHPLLDLTYVGSKVMLKLRNRYITSRYSDELYKARRAGPMREYCRHKYTWIDDIFDLIHWSLVGQVRRDLPPHQQTQTCKIMHDWLPTSHMRRCMKQGTHCPGCDEPMEMLRHV